MIRFRTFTSPRTAAGAFRTVLVALASLALSSCPGLFFEAPEGDNPRDPEVSVRLADVPFDDPDFREFIYGQQNDGEPFGPDSPTVAVRHLNSWDWELTGEIESLGGIEYLSALEELHLNYVNWDDDRRVPGGTISSLSPLTQLPSLRRLGIDNSRVTDLTPLAAVKSLDAVYAGGCDIASLEPLVDHPNLRGIFLTGPLSYSGHYYTGAVTDIAQLPELDEIGLSGFDLSDPAVLDSVLGSGDFVSLHLRNCLITDANFITRYPDLHSAALADNPIPTLPDTGTTYADLDYLDLNGLSLITNADWQRLPSVFVAPELSRLELRGAVGMETLPALTAYPVLEHLRLNGMRDLTSIEGLRGLTELLSLDIGFDYTGTPLAVSDYSPLASLTALDYLYLEGAGFTDADWSSILALGNLNHLQIYYAGPDITSIPDLSGMSSLESIHVSGEIATVDLTNVRTVQFISVGGGFLDTLLPNTGGSATTEELNVSYEPTITDISAAASLPNLRRIDANNCGALATGIRDLAVLTNLEYLGVAGTAVNPDDLTYLQNALPNLVIE